ncbi:60S ribosomal protein L35a-3 [Gracilariopsis chorda]|uniref:60S ribosomal protein L35a-3 n=1 Tax=Gracilariopsis chorda TaxID=448386 RepID=A0A2V3J374_9FLOR|nr:60S ribosomal protein L35a-3 [Gracilariopsis chorda]|eukprot:PXF48783.1 60S ribosomal protein L35a-3 [Gracilariopsis chorda]
MSQVPQVRLHVKGVHLGYKRNRRNQHCGQSRIQIEGVKDRNDAKFYLGKRIAYVYRAKTLKKSRTGEMSKYRFMWGRIIATHGNNGHVRAKFTKNLPPVSIGRPVRIMLYPSNI